MDFVLVQAVLSSELGQKDCEGAFATIRESG
jgi:hypothetical protein